MRVLRHGAVLLPLLLLFACTDDPMVPGERDLAQLRVSASVGATGINTLVITVSAADLPAPLIFNLTVSNGTATGTLRVPPGSERTFLVRAFESGGEISHEGSATVDVRHGMNPPLAITLVPRSGQVPVTVGIGSYSVVVTPATAELEVGETLQLEVSVTDADGNPVPGAEPSWATGNPARATVSPSGLVTAVAAGEVQIMAVYQGIGGVSSIIVTDGSGPSDPPDPPELPDLLPETITAGEGHTCGITTSGTAYCWGWNGAGQLGNGTTDDSHTPAQVAGISFQQISAGYAHTCGIDTSGKAYCWGFNESGQLGNGTTSTDFSGAAGPVLGGHTFRQISAGHSHTVAITTAGVAYAWGRNDVGQLGDGTTIQRITPTLVLGGRVFQQISAGEAHTVGITTAGKAYTWGSNAHGQLGDGTVTMRSSPVAVVGGYDFVHITAGLAHTVGITTAGAAYAWGSNSHGQLGIGSESPLGRLSPQPVTGGYEFEWISAGYVHTCGISTSGEASCWGWNQHGQVGDGTSATSRSTPVAVLGGHTYRQISAGGYHTFGITTAGAGFAWGNNVLGQLGDGTTDTSSTPVAVSGGATFR